MPYLAFLTQYPSQRLLHLFPYELAYRYRCVPVGAERGTLTLAASEPLDHTVIAYFQTLIQQRIFQVRCEASMIDDILRYWQRFEPPLAL
jgi:Type II secretion system (T2SS), protein E, N-terminal domain